MSQATMKQGYYPTGDGHHLYWERHGTPGGEPVFFLHGGPGGRCGIPHLEFFDLSRFDVVLFDQRGCGRSVPLGEIRDNTTGLAVEDIDGLRQHLGFEKISLLGVSWGSWLAIRYQQRYRHAVLNTTLASVFVPFAANLAAYEKTLDEGLSKLNGGLAGNRVRDIQRVLSDGCPLQQRSAALHWFKALLNDTPSESEASSLEDFVDDAAIRAIRLELHYHVHDYYYTAADEAVHLDSKTLLIQGINDAFGMASVRWLRQRTNLNCRLLNAGHNALSPALLKAIRGGTKRKSP